MIDRKAAQLSNTHILVIDEADRMADMGFLPQVARILRSVPRDRQTMLFSATLDSQIMGLISQTQDPLRFEVADTQPTVAGVAHHLFEVHRMDKTDVLVALLGGPHGLTLVFTRTKRDANRVAERLQDAGIGAAAIHGNKSQGARERALDRFESGKVATLVATDVAARGLDLDGVTHVINFDPPDEDKGYVHRTGRTGRAGRSGTAITLVLPEQEAETSRAARRLGHGEQYESAGLRSSRAKLVYTSRRGRRSKW
jgi:superfamily II DNA/RNA helicase